MIESLLGRVAGGGDLTIDETAEGVEAIMRGDWTDEQIGLLLVSLRAKGETVDEIAGAAQAMRRCMTQVKSSREGIVDTCGTGGSGSGTFNVSTAAALVAAAAGVPVAKHGNRRVTSKTGSADVLAALGVNVDAPLERVEACLDELGVCFCFAPLAHPSMRRVAEVRTKLGVPTIFNLLGPLANPAGAPFQLVGVARPELRETLAEALVRLGTRRSLVVHGADGQDEISLAGVTYVSEATADGVRSFEWSPSDFGLSPAPCDAMLVDDPEQSARVIRRILAGEKGACRDMVLLSAAAALWIAGKSNDLSECTRLAAEAIDGGAAADLLARLAEFSRG